MKFWNRAEDLPGIAALSLSKTIKMHPAVGWVRANTVANADLLGEINDSRKENAALRARISELEVAPKYEIDSLATLDEEFVIKGTRSSDYYSKRSWKCALTWRRIFGYISPYLVQHSNDSLVQYELKSSLKNQGIISGDNFKINDHDFQTISIQLSALGLIKLHTLKR